MGAKLTKWIETGRQENIRLRKDWKKVIKDTLKRIYEDDGKAPKRGGPNSGKN